MAEVTVTNEKDLVQALKNRTDTITIKGDLKNKVIQIRATGKVAWAIAIDSIAVAVIIIVSTGGTGAPFAPMIGAGAVSILGLPAAITAITIAVTAGGVAAGVAALNSLRGYKEVERQSNRLVLRRK